MVALGSIINQIFYHINQFLVDVTVIIMNMIFEIVERVGVDDSFIFGKTGVFPILDNLDSFFRTIGYSIAFVIFVFAIFRMLFPYMDFEAPAENAFQLVGRFALSLIMISSFYSFFYSKIYVGLCKMLFNHVKENISTLLNIDTKQGSILDNTGAFGNQFAQRMIASFSSQNPFDTIQVVHLLIILVMGIVMIVSACRFVVFHFEKVISTVVLIHASPLACATLVTKSSGQIFKKYFQVLCANCVVIVMNILNMKIIMAGYEHVNIAATNDLISQISGISGEGKTFIVANGTFKFITGMIIVVAMLRFARKVNNYVYSMFQIKGISDTVKGSFGVLAGVGGFVGGTIKSGGKKVGEAMKTTMAGPGGGGNAGASGPISTENPVSAGSGGDGKGVNYNNPGQGELDELKDKESSGQTESLGSEIVQQGENAEQAENGEVQNGDEQNAADTGEATKPGSPENYNNPTNNEDEEGAKVPDANLGANGDPVGDTAGQAKDTANAALNTTAKQVDSVNNDSMDAGVGSEGADGANGADGSASHGDVKAQSVINQNEQPNTPANFNGPAASGSGGGNSSGGSKSVSQSTSYQSADSNYNSEYNQINAGGNGQGGSGASSTPSNAGGASNAGSQGGGASGSSSSVASGSIDAGATAGVGETAGVGAQAGEAATLAAEGGEAAEIGMMLL